MINFIIDILNIINFMIDYSIRNDTIDKYIGYSKDTDFELWNKVNKAIDLNFFYTL